LASFKKVFLLALSRLGNKDTKRTQCNSAIEAIRRSFSIANYVRTIANVKRRNEELKRGKFVRNSIKRS